MSDPWAVMIPREEPPPKAPNREPGAFNRPGATSVTLVPKVVLGCDPGRQAFLVALSLVDDQARLWPVPSLDIGGIPVFDLRGVAAGFRSAPLCFVEKTMGRGGWGASQNFAFGAHTGGAASALVNLGWEVRAVLPQTWQKALHQTADKNPKVRSQDAYRRLFPHDPLPKSRQGRINDNALDALLIAAYGAGTLGYEPRAWVFA